MDIDVKELIKAAAQGIDLSGFKGDVVAVKVVENEIGNVEAGGIGIQNVYAGQKPKAQTKKKAEQKPKTAAKPKTLKYYMHGNNGRLRKQRQRVDIVFRLWNEWGWIDDATSPDGFDTLFEGTPSHCNITWTANATILTILLQELLQQPYIEKQTGCAAKSLVEQQFGKTANSDRTRLDEDAEDKIRLTLLVLDIRNPLPERRGSRGEEDVDVSEAALKEVFAGQLRATKGI